MIYNEDDLEEIVRDNNKMVKENNTMLRRMRREQVFGRILKILVFAAVVAAPIIFYYWYLDPYLQQFQQAYLEMKGDVEALNQLREKTPSFMQWLVDFTTGGEGQESVPEATSTATSTGGG